VLGRGVQVLRASRPGQPPALHFKSGATVEPDDCSAGVVTALTSLLLAEGHRVKACSAPRAYGAPGELCGRWFVGRPDRRFCALTCQQRVATIESRGGLEREIQAALEAIAATLRKTLRAAEVEVLRPGRASTRRVVIRHDRDRETKRRIPYVLDITRRFLRRPDATGFLAVNDRVGELIGMLRDQGGAVRLDGSGAFRPLRQPRPSVRRGVRAKTTKTKGGK
jgi:hypothetical protein